MFKKIIIILLLTTGFNSFSCSIFSLKSESFYLAGNEDWYKYESSVKFYPQNDKGYGYAVFAVSSYIDSYPQIAINQWGLAVDWATVPSIKFKSDKDKKSLNRPLITEVMRTCTSVDDVINLVKKYNISHFSQEHLIVADSSGESVVLEWNGESVEVIKRVGDYQLITNFNILNPDKGWYPCDRFEAGEALLKNRSEDERDFDLMVKTLDSMHSEGEFTTLYSYIFDLKKREITLYNSYNYDKSFKISLDRELKKGERILPINSFNYN